MIVYVVTYNFWERHEYDCTELRAVFDTEQQALDYVKNHSHEIAGTSSTGKSYKFV